MDLAQEATEDAECLQVGRKAAVMYLGRRLVASERHRRISEGLFGTILGEFLAALLLQHLFVVLRTWEVHCRRVSVVDAPFFCAGHQHNCPKMP